MAFKKKVVIVFALLAAFGLFIPFRERVFFKWVGDGAARIVVMPLFRGAKWIFMSAGVAFKKDDEQENNSDEALRLAKEEIAALQEENERLLEAVGLSRASGKRVIPASVAGFFRSAGNEVLLIDRGNKEGIAAGDFAFAEGNLYVGRVIGAGEGRSEILLPTSESESFEVVFRKAGIRARAKGFSGGEIAVDFVPLDAPVAVGDLFEVAPIPNMASSEMFLGEAREVENAAPSIFKRIRAVPLFNPRGPGTVFVITGA